jgi:3-oxoacyl-[acyl-carrier protein] reductase
LFHIRLTGASVKRRDVLYSLRLILILRCATAVSQAHFQFPGHVALVTGASRGIGAATARLLGAGGAKVYVNYLHSAERAEEVVASIRNAGGSAEAVKFDVSNPEQVVAGVGQILEREEAIDLLVNNAGVRFDGLTHGMSIESWQECCRLNLDSAFLVSREVIRPMVKRQGGSIVFVSSIAGSIGSFGQSAYAAAKAGLVALAKSIALEYGAKGIRANTVIPGVIMTDMTQNIREDFKQSVLVQIPCGRLGEPEEVAPAICFLLSDAARYINGATLHINGGGLRV